MKKPYAKIEYTNLSPDYETTICPLSDIPDNIECFKQDVEDVDEVGFTHWQESGYFPSVRISLVMMTDDEYSKWFDKYVKP